MLLKREKSTLRMGIALFLTLAFAAYICFFAEKHYTQPHRTFSALLAAVAELGGAGRLISSCSPSWETACSTA